jgi:hypothetical protein
MNEWICIPHDDKLKEHNSIQHTSYNNQIPLAITNNFTPPPPSKKNQGTESK